MLIVGLGNYTPEYAGTYHNAGFMVIDEILERLGKKMKETGCSASHVEFFMGGKRVVLAKPTTFMNLSGKAVRELSSFYKIPPAEILIIYDDIDIPAGSVRVRLAGSGGTHNGMKNVVSEMNSVLIPRMRIGIGKPEGEMPLMNYVLSKIKGENEAKIKEAVSMAADIIIGYLKGDEIQNTSEQRTQL